MKEEVGGVYKIDLLDRECDCFVGFGAMIKDEGFNKRLAMAMGILGVTWAPRYA